MTSRHSSLALILASLALLVRLLAPGVTDARIAIDPLVNAPICAHDQSSALAPDAPSKDAHVHADCDLSCCHVAPALFAPPAPDATTVSAMTMLAWRILETGFLVFHAPAAHRARGPPTVS